MKILQILEQSANSAVEGNLTWHRNLYEPLIDLGHEVILVSSQMGRRAMQKKNSKLRAAFSDMLLDLFRKEHAKKPFDLFFAYLMDGMIETSVIDDIRKVGVPACNFSCNNSHQFDLVDELSPHFDYNLHSEKDVRDKFIGIGANPFWWPMASNPKYFKPKKLSRTLDVSFVGQNYALRARYIAHLLDNGINVHAFGPGWGISHINRWRGILRRYVYLSQASLAFSLSAQSKFSSMLADHDFRRNLMHRYPQNLHKAVSDNEMISLYSRSKISLGFLEVYDRHDPSLVVKQHMHLRDFEAPMSGALYCTGYIDELSEHFVPDKEVIIYRNQHELLDKVRYYLAHPIDADRIRIAGWQRALKDHTYHYRFKTLFSEIGLEPR